MQRGPLKKKHCTPRLILATMASTRFLLIATMLAAAACAANAACESGDVFDRITGKQCEQPQKRRESVCGPS